MDHGAFLTILIMDGNLMIDLKRKKYITINSGEKNGVSIILFGCKIS